MTSNSPKLKEITPLKATVALNLLLHDTAQFFNVGKQINERQIIETSGLIITEFPHLRIDDFALFFRRFKSGFYGQTFDRLDGSVILVALRAYEEERRGEVATANAKAHEERKNSAERYNIQMGDWWLISIENKETGEKDYDCTKDKELATSYDWHTAMILKKHLIDQKAVASANIVYYNLPTEDFMKEQKEKYPWLKKPTEKEDYAAAVKKFYEGLATIDNDESLNEFERHKARERHYGFRESTQQEWEEKEGVKLEDWKD